MLPKKNFVLNLLSYPSINTRRFKSKTIGYIKHYYNEVIKSDSSHYLSHIQSGHRTKELALHSNLHLEREPQQLKGSFLKEIEKKVWQHTGKPHIAAVADKVDEFVSKLISTTNSIEPKCGLKKINSGSFYEGHYVGLPLEFDFLLEINKSAITLHSLKQVSPVKEWKLDRFEVQIFGDRNEVKPFRSCRVRNEIFKNITKALRNLGDIPDVNIIHIEDSTYRPNMRIFLTVAQQMDVMIDLVPCVKIQKDLVSRLPKLSERTINFMSNTSVIPTSEAQEIIYDNLYLIGNKNNSDWRISTSCVESKLFDLVSDDDKRHYRILKHFTKTFFVQPALRFSDPHRSHCHYRDRFGFKPSLSSCFLKLLFLHQVQFEAEQKYCSALYRETVMASEKEVHLPMFLKLKHYVEQCTEGRTKSVIMNSLVFEDQVQMEFPVNSQYELTDLDPAIKHIFDYERLDVICLHNNRYQLASYGNIWVKKHKDKVYR